MRIESNQQLKGLTLCIHNILAYKLLSSTMLMKERGPFLPLVLNLEYSWINIQMPGKSSLQNTNNEAIIFTVVIFQVILRQGQVIVSLWILMVMAIKILLLQLSHSLMEHRMKSLLTRETPCLWEKKSSFWLCNSICSSRWCWQWRPRGYSLG